METFRGKKVIIPRVRDWRRTDETDRYSLTQRLKCRVESGPLPYEVLREHQDWTLEDLQKHMRICTLYPFDVGLQILRIFKPKRWLDPTAGWGDRLRCAIEYGCEYVGVDSNKTMKSAYNAIIAENARDVSKYKVISNKFQTAKITGLFDLVFTSPPFFTKEVYEDMKSWKNVEDFLEDFLRPMLKKAYKHMELDGHLVLYIEDMPGAEFIDTMKFYIIEELPGLQYEGVIYYQGGKMRPHYVWKRID